MFLIFSQHTSCRALEPDYCLFINYQMPADKYEGLNQWFSTFLVERNPNETFQRLEEPLCGNLIDLCQGGPTSALLWATFQNYSSHNQLKTPIFVPKSGCTLKKKVFTWNRSPKFLFSSQNQGVL